MGCNSGLCGNNNCSEPFQIGDWVLVRDGVFDVDVLGDSFAGKRGTVERVMSDGDSFPYGVCLVDYDNNPVYFSASELELYVPEPGDPYADDDIYVYEEKSVLVGIRGAVYTLDVDEANALFAELSKVLC